MMMMPTATEWQPDTVADLIPAEQEPVSDRRELLLLLLGLMLLSVIIWLPITSGASFYADDLRLLQGQIGQTLSSNLWQTLTEAPFYKYRPVTSLLCYITFIIFNDNFFAYIIFNALLYGFCAFLLARLVYLANPGKIWFAFSVGLCVVGSRFALYHCSQRLGLMEIVSILFLILIASSIYHAYTRNSLRSLWFANLYLILLVFTHERFVVLCPIVSLCTFLASPSGVFSKINKIKLICTTLIIGFLNYAIKTYVLDVPFMTGTMTIPIEFLPKRILQFIWSGLLNMVGFNAGEPYLSAFDFRNVNSSYFPGILVLVGEAGLVTLLIRKARGSEDRPWCAIFIATAATLALVSSASVTIRQEFRWLLPPYIIVIIAISLAFTYVRSRGSTPIAMVFWSLFMLGTLWNDAVYRKHLPNVFLSGWFAASQTERALAEAFAPQIREGKMLYFVNGEVLRDAFVQYAQAPNAQVRSILISDMSSLPRDNLAKSLFFIMDKTQWRYVPSADILACYDFLGSSSIVGACLTNLDLVKQIQSNNWYFTLQAAATLTPLDPKAGEAMIRKSIALLSERCANPYPYYDLGRLLESEHREREAYDAFKTAFSCSGKDGNPAFSDGMKRTAPAKAN
jgi:hypothetical protein